jgi:acyl transferase domain-containing protein
MSQRSVVFMFSGQGSQYYQMGRPFFDGNATFRRILVELNDLATPLLGRSIIDVLYNDGRRKDELFNEITLTSVAIFIVEYALAKMLMDEGIKPDYLLASSMGIYAAAAVASALPPADILRSLAKMAAIYETRCKKGGMITILGNQKLHHGLSVLRQHSDIAALNFESHFVISATDEHLGEIEAVLLREKVAFQKVAVSYPFHSRWIDGAREAALEVLGTMQYRQSKIPLICWSAVRKPIEFERTIAKLEKREPRYYIDVGPAGTLATFQKYILPSTSASKSYPILSPFGTEMKNYARLASERGLFENPSNAQHRNLHG